MSYKPTTWKKGDKVTSTKLNKIEQGIQGNDSEISELKSGLSEKADAKATEDAIDAVKEKISRIGKRTGVSNIQWSDVVENRKWRSSDGALTNYNYCKSVYTDLVPCNPGDVFLYTGVTNNSTECPCALFYGDDGTYISAENGNTGTNGSQISVTIPENTYNVRFQLSIIGIGVQITEHDVIQTNPASVEFIESQIEKQEEANGDLAQRVGVSDIVWTVIDNKLFKKTDGKLANYNYCRTAYTNLIPCSPGNVFLYEGFTNDPTTCACALYYNENGVCIGYEGGYVREYMMQAQKTITIPNDACFVRFQLTMIGQNQTVAGYKASQILPYSTIALHEENENTNRDVVSLGKTYSELPLIYDESEIIQGILKDDGTVDQSITGTPTKYWTTGYIEVDPTQVYYAAGFYKLCAYNQGKTYINPSPYNNNNAYINFTSETVKYVRISMSKSSYNNTFMFTKAGFYSVGKVGNSLEINEKIVEAINDFGLYQIAANNSKVFVRSSNLFDIYSSNWAYMAEFKGDGKVNGIGNYANGSIATDYIHVNEGDVICSNMRILRVAAYDSNKSFVQQLTPRGVGDALCWIVYVPADVEYIRITGAYSNNGTHGYDTDAPNGWMRSEDEIGKWLIWKADSNSKLYPRDAAPESNHAIYKIPGEYVSPDFSEVPDRDSEFMRMVRCESIRAVNHTKHVYRIGNFNQYIQRYQNNWPVIKKMLADYGIDICGFEEAQYFSSQDFAQKGSIGDYLRGWQFGYCPSFYPTGTTESPYSNRDAVSIFPIVESEELPFPNVGQSSYNNRSALRTKIKLPRYLDCTGGDQYLGFYVIHPTVDASYDKQEAEIQVCLDAMETDGCAFHIVAADSNAFAVNPETGMPIVWDWMVSKGFKLANNGWSKTVTDPSPDHNGSIDQIFVSDNVRIVNFNVINSNEYSYFENNAKKVVPLSDHDFIYADVEFDYSNVITKMRPMTEIALIQNLTHVSSDTADNYHLSITPTTTTVTSNYQGTLDESVIVNLTAETGYSLASVTVYIGGNNRTSSYYNNGVVNIPTGTTVNGDIVITATAEAT